MLNSINREIYLTSLIISLDRRRMYDKRKTFIPIYFDALFYKVFGEEDKKKFLIYIIEETLKVKIKSIKVLNGKVLGERFSTKRAYLVLFKLI